MMASKASVTEGSGLPEDMLRLKYPLVDFWCLMPLSAIFQLYHGDLFVPPNEELEIAPPKIWMYPQK
jgi:hypothetical protein